MKLLIVEDEKRLCQTVAKHLKAEGYAVDFCHDGTDAVDYMAGTEYDAVILDKIGRASCRERVCLYV